METDQYSGPVPGLLLGVGFFLLAESLTFTTLALRSNGFYRVDFLDFAFVFAGALLVTIIGMLEGRRLRSRPIVLSVASLTGVVLGVLGGFLAIWLSGFGR
jgi:hypothetical protein